MTAALRSQHVVGRGLRAVRRVLRTRRRRVAALAAIGVVLGSAGAALSLVAFGADDGRREALYLSYRSAEERRHPAEERLREAFSDLDAATDRGDRRAALAAIDRGREAAAEIDGLLTTEIEAAGALARFGELAPEARRLEKALRTSRSGLALFDRMLDVGTRDPFLEAGRNRSEVDRLAREAAVLSVDGEFARRRADRAVALAIGVEPTFDVLFDLGANTRGIE